MLWLSLSYWRACSAVLCEVEFLVNANRSSRSQLYLSLRLREIVHFSHNFVSFLSRQVAFDNWITYWLLHSAYSFQKLDDFLFVCELSLFRWLLNELSFGCFYHFDCRSWSAIASLLSRSSTLTTSRVRLSFVPLLTNLLTFLNVLH